MNISNPFFSVIITTFNRDNIVGNTINSVLNQSFTDYEIIVVDDGSTDSTISKLEKITSIDLYKLEKNTGQANATNFALSKSRGSWICFLDSDDTWTNDRLEIMYELISQHHFQDALYYSASFVFSAERKFLRVNPATYSGYDVNYIKLHNPIGGQSRVIVSKAMIDNVGGLDLSLLTCKDWDLWIRLCEEYHVYSIDKPLVNYYETDDSISSDCNKLIKGRKIFWNKHYPNGFTKREESISFLMLAKILYNRGDVLNARKFFVQAYLANPFNIKLIGYSLFSCIPRGISLTFYNLILRFNK